MFKLIGNTIDKMMSSFDKCFDKFDKLDKCIDKFESNFAGGTFTNCNFKSFRISSKEKNNIQIGNKTYNGKNIRGVNNKIIIDDNIVLDSSEIPIIIINSDVNGIDTTSVIVNGNVNGDIDCTSIKVAGNVKGDIDGTNVTIEGNYEGNIDGLNVTINNKGK